MKRNDFLRTSSLLFAGGLLTPYTSCNTKNMGSMRKNWAGNYTYKADNYYEPASAEELQQLVKKLGKQKALDLGTVSMTLRTAQKIKYLPGDSTNSCIWTQIKTR